MGEQPEIAAPSATSEPAGAASSTSAAPIVALPKSFDAVDVAKVAKVPKVVKTKKPRVKPNHPKTAEMVNEAISAMNERHGSSLKAIKTYISTTYGLDTDKQAPFIKKYLRDAVTSGVLIHTSGHGVVGSFKLAKSKRPPSRSARSRNRSATLKRETTKKSVDKPIAAARMSATMAKGDEKSMAKKTTTVGEKPKTVKKDKRSRGGWRVVKSKPRKGGKVKTQIVAAELPNTKTLGMKRDTSARLRTRMATSE